MYIPDARLKATIGHNCQPATCDILNILHVGVPHVSKDAQGDMTPLATPAMDVHLAIGGKGLCHNHQTYHTSEIGRQVIRLFRSSMGTPSTANT